jgi:hypothetical protein
MKLTILSQLGALISFNWHCGGWSPAGSNSARRPMNSLFYLPRVILMMRNLVEWRLAGETEVAGENMPQSHFVHHNSHLTRPGTEPGPPQLGSQRLTAWAMARPITRCFKTTALKDFINKLFICIIPILLVDILANIFLKTPEIYFWNTKKTNYENCTMTSSKYE